MNELEKKFRLDLDEKAQSFLDDQNAIYFRNAANWAFQWFSRQQQWIDVKSELPPRHQNVLCYNRDGRIFEGRMCYGMHEPFFTYPHGDGNASNTCPSWIDVTHWRSLLPEPPKVDHFTTQ